MATQNGAAQADVAVERDTDELAPVDPSAVDNEVLKRALKRARDRLHTEVTAKHSSHSSHKSHGTAAW